MELNLESLKDAGAFAPVGLVKETIVWRQDGDELHSTAYIKPLSYLTVEAESKAAQEDANPLAVRIAASVFDAEGNPVFSVGDIAGTADPERGPLCPELTMALLEAIGRVSGLGKKRSRSAMTRNSGTSS